MYVLRSLFNDLQINQQSFSCTNLTTKKIVIRIGQINHKNITKLRNYIY